MKHKLLTLILIVFLLQLAFVSAKEVTKYDKDDLSKLYQFTANSDGTIKLTKKGTEIGSLSGTIKVEGKTLVVKNGKFRRWSGNYYTLVNGNFKIDAANNFVTLGKSTSKTKPNYVEMNDFRVICDTKDCAVKAELKKQDTIIVEKGGAKFSPALKDLDKQVQNTRKKRRTKPELKEFSVDVSNIKIIVLNEKDYKFTLSNLEKDGKFGWTFLSKDDLNLEFKFDTSKDSKKPVLGKLQGKEDIQILHAKFESTIDSNALSLSSDKNILYYYNNELLARISKATIVLTDELEDYEGCKSIYSADKLTCINFNPLEKTLRFYEKEGTLTDLTYFGTNYVNRIIINPLKNKQSIFRMANFKSQQLVAKYDSLSLKYTQDWKDIGISFVIFVYNKKTKLFDRIECDLTKRQCTLNNKPIYDPVKKLRCKTDADCARTKASNLKCINEQCVVPKKCESLVQNANSPINVLVVATGYETKQQAIADAKKLIDSNGQNNGLFAKDPFSKFKKYFSFYFMEAPLQKISGEDTYKVDHLKKSCSGYDTVIVFDNNAVTCEPKGGYCPFYKYTLIQIPTKKFEYSNVIGGILAHEAGHKWGKLNDEYYSVPKVDFELPPRRMSYKNDKNFYPLNCLPAYRAHCIWSKKDYNAALSYRSCGAGCSKCNNWIRPTKDSLMNRISSMVKNPKFNKISKEQLEYFLRRFTNQPMNTQDKKIKEMLKKTQTSCPFP